MNLRNLKIGQRLGLSFALVATLLVIISATSYARIVKLGQAIDLTTDDRYPKIKLAHTIKDELNETARGMRNLLLLDEQKSIDAEHANIAESSRVIADALDKLGNSITSDRGRELMKELISVRQRFLTERAAFIELVKSGDKEAARQDLLTRARPIQLEYFSKLDQIIDLQNNLMDASGKDADTAIADARLQLLILSTLAILACVMITYFATRSITAPLQLAVNVARKVADGDLTSDIRITSSDETGQLMQALKAMNEGLVKIVSQVRTGTESMAAASGQIASGNMDLSSRTEQQASSLEETASSMEEMTSTVKQNGENARQANTLAASASQVAVAGGKVVANVVDTMGAINESSKKIVDIIAVIDGIAFQTNILALNAAVEAARAGEQGRGFAVVASEVRNLAQRSAAAAKEIKVLIGDSVEKVEFGAKLVDQAGNTMQEIVDSVQRVTDIMSEIAAASGEQEAGIDQINQAVTEMDAVTQQNAALVEEAAAAADALQEQAAGLAAVVSTFRIQDTGAHRPIGPAPVASPAPAPRLGARRPKALAPPPRARARAPAGAQDKVHEDEWEAF